MAFFRSIGKLIASCLKLGVKNYEERKLVAMARTSQHCDQCHEILVSHLNLRVRIVNERQVMFMSRYGQFKETLVAAVHFTVPFVDRVIKTI